MSRDETSRLHAGSLFLSCILHANGGVFGGRVHETDAKRVDDNKDLTRRGFEPHYLAARGARIRFIAQDGVVLPVA